VRRLRAAYLGRRPYGPVLELMDALVEARGAGTSGDLLLLLEHEAVITGGRGAKTEHVVATPETLLAEHVTYYETKRGGDVTLHAPGQLVAYPILDLKPDRADVRKYVQSLTNIMAELCLPFGIEAGTFPGKIGLWADVENPGTYRGVDGSTHLAKLGAVGVRISRWITSHGFALNLTTDLGLFEWIVPCGIADFPVASVQSLTGHTPQLDEVAARAAHLFGVEFASELTYLDLSAVPLPELAQRLLETAPAQTDSELFTRSR
jgi:lipoyl(octanoyl) transferase